MQRDEFLDITFLTVDELKTRTKRSQMPRYGTPGRNEYTPFDAFLVKITEEVGDQKIGLTGAALNVRNSSLQLRKDWVAIKASKPAYMFGVARIDAADGHGQFEKPLFGTFDDVRKQLAEFKPERVDWIKLTNASRAWQKVRARAKEIGADISDVFGSENDDAE